MLCLTAGLPDSIATMYYRVLHGSNLSCSCSSSCSISFKYPVCLLSSCIYCLSTAQLATMQASSSHSCSFSHQAQIYIYIYIYVKLCLCMVTNRFLPSASRTPSSDLSSDATANALGLAISEFFLRAIVALMEPNATTKKLGNRPWREVRDLLRSPTYVNQLRCREFKLHPDLFRLSYDMVSADWTDPFIRECRGEHVSSTWQGK